MTASNQVGSRLTESFMRYFDVVCATTEEQKRAVYGIRYNVYCAEFGYEPLENFPDRREHDEFDGASIHALITHRESGRPAGCVRVVPPQGQPDAASLPLQSCHFCLLKLSIFSSKVVILLFQSRQVLFFVVFIGSCSSS